MMAAIDSLPLAASDSHPVPAAAAARFFRVLGNPTRLRILELLLAGPHTVAELTAAAGAPRARVSNHLACLRWCGFAEAERRGRQVIYRAADPRLAALLAAARPLIADKAGHLASCQRIGPDWI
jgi:DNA-binding transcriptional ArsR family regulator